MTKNYTILIKPALTIAPAALAGGDVGVLYSRGIIVSNGATPYTVLTVTGYNAGTTGLTAPTVNVAAGTVTFNSTPTATGTVTFTVNATDSGRRHVNQELHHPRELGPVHRAPRSGPRG